MPIRLNSGIRIGAIGLAVAVASCAPFKPALRVQPQDQVPQAFCAGEAEAPKPDRWWVAFGSPELTALVDKALAGNLSIEQAWARLAQARALAAQSGADLLPHLDANSGFIWTRRKSETGQTGQTGQTRTGVSQQLRSQTRQYSLGLAASYEVDLWGRVRSQRDAARYDVAASRADLEAAAISLAAAVTDRWLRILQQRADLALLHAQLESNKTSLELMELRFRMGQATALDLDEQQQAVARVEAQVPLVEAQQQVLVQQLAVLLGRALDSGVTVTTSALPEVPHRPATGVPADLLIMRPDVRAAWERVCAADHRVAAARADRLPALRLTGSAAYQGPRRDLFDNWIETLAANLALPIIDAGRRRAEVDRTHAVVQERLAVYKQTVLTAVQEVDEALVREGKQLQHVAGLAKQLKYARMALDEARERYTKGQDDYLRVLTALTSVQGLERDLIRTRRERLSFRVNLYRALGGDWVAELAPAGAAQQGDAHKTRKDPS